MGSIADADGRANGSDTAIGSQAATAKAGVPIAVIGIGCRLPGGIESPEQLWHALLRGDDLVTEVPLERWDNDDVYDPQPGTPGRTTSRWGAFLDDVAGFDAQFFGLGDREAAALDPQHRLLLETSWEAMEHAGLTPQELRDSLAAVFVGLTHNDYQTVSAASEEMAGRYRFSGSTFAMAAGRIAHTLGLQGPAVAVDTACSSGLYAVHAACRSLVDGESDLAFAGGAYVMLDPQKYVAGTAAGHLSPTGRCQAFDVAADGYVSGEASAMVLLKRLPDALRDGDRVLAVVRGTAANQDNLTAEISTPSVIAQTAVYQAALKVAGVGSGSIGMVEAHGPGTPAGDPIEYASLSATYGIEGPCALASMKTNVGHTHSASGVLGLIKAVLALQHGVVPKNLHFTALPAELARINTNLFVPQETTPWPMDGVSPRRAAVSSYGVSGTNVHAILEQAPDNPDIGTGRADAGGGAPLLFALSSTSAPELRRSAGRLADWVQAHNDVALPDLAYTLARRRAHRPVRTAVIAGDAAGLTATLREIADGDGPLEVAIDQGDRGPVWVFSGQGPQWAGMGTHLLATEPEFAATVARVEPLIAAESGFSVTEAMTSPEVMASIDRVQPTLFTMQVAMAAAMAARGVRPGAVIGHSIGETAAAVVAGALSLEDGVRVSCRRSRLMASLTGSGAMASVPLSAKQVLAELNIRGIKDVVVAEVASPQSTVISGAAETAAELTAMWAQHDVMVRPLAVDVASQSPQVDPILDELTAALAEAKPMTPQIPFYSATGFDPREQPLCNNKYWVRNLRNTVRFSAAVRAAMEDGYRVFAELAPDPMLAQAIDETAAGVDIPLVTLAAMRRGQDLPFGLATFVADLHSAGAAIDFAVPHPHGRLLDAPLPTWTRQQLWLSPEGQTVAGTGGHTVAVHPLLGSHVRIAEQPERHVWQAEVGTAAHPWLVEHQIGGVAVLPGAAYCEMALSAAQVVFGQDDQAVEVRDLRFEHALVLEDHTTISASASLWAPGVAEFGVASDSGGEHLRQAGATLHTVDSDAPAGYDLTALVAAHPRRADGDEVRAGLARRGVQYGPAFGGLQAVHVDDAAGTVLAEVTLPSQIRSQHSVYGVHPALLDACFQSVAASPQLHGLGTDIPVLPVGLRTLRSYGILRTARYCYARITGVDDTGFDADLDILDGEGTVLLHVHGLRCRTNDSQGPRKDRMLRQRLLNIDWRQRELPEPDHSAAGTWLLISATDDDARASSLAEALKTLGAQQATVCWPHNDEHTAAAPQLAEHLQTGAVAGIVILTAPANADAAESNPAAGGSARVHHLVGITQAVLSTGAPVPRLYLVTYGARNVLGGEVPNLEQAGVRGLLRVIGSEYPHAHPTLIDVDAATDPEHLAAQLLCGSAEDETAWRDNTWYTARMVAAPLGSEDRHTTVAEYDRDGIRLQIRIPGDPQTLEPVGYQRTPPGPGQVEIAVHASSLNFADVLVAMGRYPSIDGNPPPALGMDFAGVVSAVGPDVTDHKVGDHVGGISPNGCWSSFVTCDARLAVPLPIGLSDQQAAAAATATATAWYGLHELAKITAEDRVLIQSATGGVGQAAIAIARAAGAQIFATAGSKERRQLLRNMGIEHIYDSRSTDFADQIRKDTDGGGVDIVLNSLTGPAQRAGFELLAVGGRFVEIGKRDVYDNTRLGLLPFHRNLTFYYLDLALMSSSHPQRVGRLLATVFGLVADGTLPPAECTTYPLADAATALRVMSAAQHTGKLLLEIPDTGHTTVVRPAEFITPFRGDSAYVVTGGLGGLGLFLAEKMATGGAGRIVLNSRTQPSRKTRETIELIRQIGSDVVVACGDIADPATARELIATATATGLPLRGVLHVAAVIDDATLPNLNGDLIDRDWAAKVNGAWNLHCALEEVDQPLDWFCCFSSASALIGSPGQGAYAAADSWLDTFAVWRRAQGRPATTIAWGAWDQLGRATTLADTPGQAVEPDDGAYAFDTLLRHDRPYTAYAPVIGTDWLSTFAKRSPFAEAFTSTEPNSTGTKLRAELETLSPDEWAARIRRLISDQISLILRRTVDPDRPLSEYGVDSLGAMELRTRIEAETGIRLTSADLAVGTVRGLAELLCRKLAPAPTDVPA